MRPALLTSALLALSPVCGMAGSPDLPALRNRLSAALESEGLTGATWALVVPESPVLVDAAGVRDARSGAALVATDRVQVGSVAKTVLATGVLRLVSEGLVALDAPVAELLPELRFDNRWNGNPVRLRHLLDHTSGLDDARLHQVFSLRVAADAPLASSLTGRALRVRSRPGDRFSYSNTGYTLLGMVIEKITGERYETWLDRELLRPLGMEDSTFQFVSQEGAGADPRLAMGHFDGAEPHVAVPLYLRPSSQFTTTSADMGRFAVFLMSDGVVDGRRLVDPRWLRAMGQPHETEAARAGLATGYALGLVMRDRHGVVGRCHSGNTVGYRAMFCLFPAEQRAFFVAFNTDSETANYGRIDAMFIDALGLAPAIATPVQAGADDAASWQGFYVPSPNRFATFEWLDNTLGFVRVSANHGIELKPFLGSASKLSPMGNGLWKAEGRVLASHVLVHMDERRWLSTGTQTYEHVPLGWMLLRWVSLAAGLVGAVWLLISGIVRAVARRLPRSHPVLLPWLGMLALLLPLPLFLMQSFLAIGDPTAASVSLAIVSLLLPVTLVSGLVRQWRQRRHGVVATLDTAAMLTTLQLLVVLAFAGWVPVRLWA